MIFAFMPLRCGSKSIEFKNIKNLCGKPLCYWNLEALQKSAVDKVVIATDCDEIYNVVSSFCFSKVEIYRRDAKNAQDCSSSESVMLEYINHNKNLFADDIFMLVQATSPLTETKDFDEAIADFKEKNIDSLLSCVKIKRFFWDNEGNALNYDFKKRPRRQDFDGCFMENGAFYITKVKNIQHSQNRIAGNIGIYEMEEYKGIEIDEEVDWHITEFLMKNYQSQRLQTKMLPIKLFVSDVDGTLTDGGMYYYDNGVEGKKFSSLDGKGFEILRKHGIKTAILTGENNSIIEQRAKKLAVDYLYMGLNAEEKRDKLFDICKREKISPKEVAYIGDDVNCLLVLMCAGQKACPINAHEKIKSIEGIIQLNKKGGDGAVREFIDQIIEGNCNDIF
ncbi:acylneuraminate cytidylyltransferase [Helicobacter equorum]|uniref:acylneuraminate cytidylyltransferase n=1 Tax=Helicobacter equorum TaxID=361872 RepID=UPI000CF0675B|nr:acylneuraminate cytidylyltransferase [Helicobacter equorum]